MQYYSGGGKKLAGKSKSYMAEFTSNPDSRLKSETSYADFINRLKSLKNDLNNYRIGINKIRNEYHLKPFLDSDEFEEIVNDSLLEGEELYKYLIEYGTTLTIYTIKHKRPISKTINKTIPKQTVQKASKLPKIIPELSTEIIYDKDEIVFAMYKKYNTDSIDFFLFVYNFYRYRDKGSINSSEILATVLSELDKQSSISTKTRLKRINLMVHLFYTNCIKLEIKHLNIKTINQIYDFIYKIDKGSSFLHLKSNGVEKNISKAIAFKMLSEKIHLVRETILKPRKLNSLSDNFSKMYNSMMKDQLTQLQDILIIN